MRWKTATGLDADWREEAACRHSDANLFFPHGSTGPATGQAEAAKEVCRGCPVRASCLQFALETNQEDGVWGGTDETERRRLRREWRVRSRVPIRSMSL